MVEETETLNNIADPVKKADAGPMRSGGRPPEIGCLPAWVCAELGRTPSSESRSSVSPLGETAGPAFQNEFWKLLMEAAPKP